MRMHATSVAAVSALLLSGSVTAGTVVLDGLGGAVTMQSKDLRPLGVFGDGSPQFTNAAMRAITEDIKSDGINMDRVVTYILGETDDGLAFLSIVDDITQTGTGDDLFAQMGMSTTGPDSANGYINDAKEDIDQYFDPPNGTQTFAGHFTWNADRAADGFAWSQLQAGDFVSFNYARGGPDYTTFPGLRRQNTFQFLSWNGQRWERITFGEFSSTEQFAFTFTVIPLPAPIALGVLGLVGVATARRRARPNG